MSFIYSRALVEAFSEANCSDTDVSAQLSGNPTPKLFLWHDKTMEVSRHSRFGMTCRPLTDGLGAELLTWWQAGFPARTSASPERVQASPESDQACGATWRASLAKFDPATSSWKTVQLSLLGDSELSSVTWPRSGMTANGQCWELPTLERPISGTGSGFWLGTPTAAMSVRSGAFQRPAMTPSELVQQFPKRGMWPTPTVCGNYNRKGSSATSGDGLATAVKMWATPVSRDYRHPGRTLFERTGSKSGDCLPQQVGGALNPTWVEWLMGWPMGWTALKPSETANYQPVQQPHGECLEGHE